MEKTFFEGVALSVGLALTLILKLVTGEPVVSSLIGPTVGAYLANSVTKWSYIPDMGQISNKNPELTLLMFFAILFKNSDKQAIFSYFRITDGRLTPDVRRTLTEIPERCVVLMHHRRHHHPGLTVQEFNDLGFILSNDKPFKIITGRGWGGKNDLISKGLAIFEKYLYNAVDVNGCYGDSSCHYRVYQAIPSSGPFKLAIFPDKHGAQFYGDHRMFYRSGAFAAAIASGLPIVDTISMYPTFAHQYHTSKITRVIVPDSSWPYLGTSASLEEFEAFRDKHKDFIDKIRLHMQENFIQDVIYEESKIGSCDASVQDVQEMCTRCVYTNGTDNVICNNYFQKP